MATYIYETIPDYPDAPVARFEIQQSMKDAPLTAHPQTGQPVRRVITGGYGLMGLPKRGDSAVTHFPASDDGGGHTCSGPSCCGGGMCGMD